MHHTDPKHAILLGSLIGGIEAIDSAIASKILDLERMGKRLLLLEAHDALCLLRSAFAIPKLLHILRTAPCFLSSSLLPFDEIQRSLLEGICNIKLSNDSWKQSSLPINSGGLVLGALLCWHPLPTWLQQLAAFQCTVPSYRQA